MFYKNKKVLVTGAGGLVGSQVAKMLHEQGAIVRASYRGRKVPSWVGDVETVKADFMNIEDVKKCVEGMDIVFVCSANTSGAGVMAHDPLQHVTPNLIMNSTLMEQSYRAGVERFFFVSSATTYPPADYPIKEEEMMSGDPYTTYFGVGWMKRYTEILGQFYQRNEMMKIATVRPANIYGIQGDFTDDAVFEDLIEKVQGESVDLVISDMAPNITGIRAIDQPGSMHLAELALDFARSILREGAYFLVKVFEGEGIGEFKQILSNEFEKVKVRKPKASRSRSRELYLLAEKYRNL